MKQTFYILIHSVCLLFTIAYYVKGRWDFTSFFPEASARSLMVHVCVCVFRRQTTLAVYFMSLVGMIVYAATLSLGHLWVVFITAGSLGYAATPPFTVCLNVTRE